MAEENAPAQAAAPAEGGGSNGPKPIIFFIVTAVNMLFILGIGFMVYSSKKKEAAEPTIKDVIKGEHETQAKEKEETDKFIGQLVPLETFLVNPAGSRGRRLLKVNMELEVADSKVQEEIEKRKPQLRDIIILMLSSKSYEQISSADGQRRLREEIKDAINGFLTKGQVKQVLFTDYMFN